jgi:alpha-1,6-mannosyltransferase
VRIVRVANFIAPRSGGIRTALHELGAGYLAAGHEPVLVMPAARASDQLTGQGRVITLWGPVVPFTGGYRILLGRRRLAALLGVLRPDRLEVSDRTTLRWTGPWARAHGIPALMVSHDSVGRILSGLRAVPARAAALLADLLNSRTARHYRQVVCTTAWAEAEFARLGAANVTRVPLGVDLDLFSPGRRSPEVRARYAAPGEYLLVHCGRLSVEKKPHRSLAALAGLRVAGVPAVLVVAGDGPLRPRLARQAARAGLPAVFTGFVSGRRALAALLASADVAIAPGPAETFCLSALEALACGTPVVGSAGCAAGEVIGQAGVTVPGEGFAAGIATVLGWPESERRAAARQRAEEFGWPASVEGFLAAHQAAGAGP